MACYMLILAGVNPLATISALSERSVSLIAERSGLSIDLETENQPLNAYSKPSVSWDCQNHQNSTKKAPQSIGWQFTEIMHGHVRMGSEIGSFAVAERVGKGASCSMWMFLTVEICRRGGKKSGDPSNSRMLTVQIYNTKEYAPGRSLVTHYPEPRSRLSMGQLTFSRQYKRMPNHQLFHTT
jgi:hypothetical protein